MPGAVITVVIRSSCNDKSFCLSNLQVKVSQGKIMIGMKNFNPLDPCCGKFSNQGLTGAARMGQNRHSSAICEKFNGLSQGISFTGNVGRLPLANEAFKGPFN